MENESWDAYWEGTDRPEKVYIEFFGKGSPLDDVDLEEIYGSNAGFAKAIDEDFVIWLSDEP